MDRFTRAVLDKIDELGVKGASKLFGVSTGTISNWSSGKTRPSLNAVDIALGEEAINQADWQKPQAVEPTIDIPLEYWEGKKVLMLLPVYRSFAADTHYTLFANYAKYGPDKVGMIQEKRTVIHEARNILIDKALKTGAEWFIFVDDDMILPCGSAELFNGRYGAGVSTFSASLNAISRIMSHSPDKRIVGALYFGRHSKGKAQCSSGFSSENENINLHKGVYKDLKVEEWIGTGFLKIHRSVFDDMKAAIDGGRFPECKPQAVGRWYGYFTPLRVGIGEDVSFGRRATELGIKSYLDTQLIALHTGETFFGPKNTS